MLSGRAGVYYQLIFGRQGHFLLLHLISVGFNNNNQKNIQIDQEYEWWSLMPLYKILYNHPFVMSVTI